MKAVRARQQSLVLGIRRVTKPTEQSRLNREYARAVDWLVEASLRACELSRVSCNDNVLKSSQDEVTAALAACNSARRAIRDYTIQPKMAKEIGAHGSFAIRASAAS